VTARAPCTGSPLQSGQSRRWQSFDVTASSPAAPGNSYACCTMHQQPAAKRQKDKVKIRKKHLFECLLGHARPARRAPTARRKVAKAKGDCLIDAAAPLVDTLPCTGSPLQSGNSTRCTWKWLRIQIAGEWFRFLRAAAASSLCASTDANSESPSKYCSYTSENVNHCASRALRTQAQDVPPL